MPNRFLPSGAGGLDSFGLCEVLVHEIDEAFQDAWIEAERFFHHVPVALVVFIPEHMHECAVVHAMHAQIPHKIPNNDNNKDEDTPKKTIT